VLAFQEVGVDGIYIPGLHTRDEVAKLCAAADVPVNVLTTGPMRDLSREDFAGLGVARISLGSQLARATHRVIKDAAEAMLGDGDFTSLANSLPGSECDVLLSKGAGS
jgi:2-methylisocitrate lyase-like PEP mutase family enzyme